MYHGSYFFSYKFSNKTIQSFSVFKFCLFFVFKDISLCSILFPSEIVVMLKHCYLLL